MKKKSPLLGALPIIAQALGRRLGVNVVIGGQRARTDGRTIYLPELPAEGEALATLANGFIDHEAAHIRYTDFTVQKPDGLAGLLVGLLEDIRIEQALGADYPGSRHNLAALVASLEAHEPVRLPPEGAADIPVVQALYCILRAQVLGQQALASAATAMEEWIEQRLPAGVAVKLLALAFEVRKAASTADVRALALRIVAMLEEAATRPPESPPTGDGAGEAGTPGASPNTRTGSDPQDSRTPGDTPDAGLDSSASGASGDSAGDAGTPGASPNTRTSTGDTPDAGLDSSASGASGDGAGEAVRRQALASLLASDDKDCTTDLGARAGQWLVDVAREENRSLPVTLAEYDDPPSNRDPAAAVAQARAATAALRRRLGTLVQAHRHEEDWRSRRGHRLDTTGLYRLTTGDPARFLRSGEQVALATAVGLLLDRSGSMDRRIGLAGHAVLATALALEDLDGVSAWVAAFPGRCESRVVLLKDFAERARRVAGRFSLTAGGGTPLASALWRAGFELSRRPEPRRLLIVATDGQPNDVAAAHDIISRCRASGIEVMGLGIGPSLAEVREVFGERDAMALEAITTLAPALFALLERRLTAAG